MHIPDSMIQGPICPVTAIISTAGVATAAYYACRSNKQPSVQRFAAVSSLIFAAQMLNFPVQSGTSGHLIGGVLAAAMLGIPFGVIATALVVALQCIFFADGGIMALGANVLNMALIGAGLGGIINKLLSDKITNKPVKYIGIFSASWLSVMLAALAASSELAISGTIEFGKVSASMLSVHALIGLGEGIITVIACMLFETNTVEASETRKVWAPTITAVIAAMLISPFACSMPDGLEWVAEKLNFLKESAPNFVSTMPDYTIPVVNSEIFSTSLAGLAGVAITFVFAGLIGVILKKAENK